MKTLNLFLASIMMAIAISVSAQVEKTTDKNVDVPEHITTKFSHEYPQTPDTKWKMEGDSYVVEFTTADSEHKKIWYDKAGEKQNEEQTLDTVKDLTNSLRDLMTGKYAGYKVNKISEVKNVGRTSYRVRLEKDGENKDILLDAKGKEIDSAR